jgi:hypothetical protein
MDVAVRLPPREVLHLGEVDSSMTFGKIERLSWPEVEQGTSYGSPALQVRKKLLTQRRLSRGMIPCHVPARAGKASSHKSRTRSNRPAAA